MASTLTQRVQGAIASATSEASSPQAQAEVRQAADTAARNVARASWFSFAALIVGAIIAIVSGHAGFRHQPPFEEATGPSTGNLPLRRDATRGADSRPYRLLSTSWPSEMSGQNSLGCLIDPFVRVIDAAAAIAKQPRHHESQASPFARWLARV